MTRFPTFSTSLTRHVAIAIEGLGWELFSGLLEKGRLRYLRQLCELGSRSPLFFPPPSTPASAWTTVATGVHADVHGILLPFERIGDTGLSQAAGGAQLRVEPIWCRLDRAGMSSAVINWPVTERLELRNGYVVAPGFEVSPPPGVKVWPLNPRSYAPPALRAAIENARLSSDEIELSQVAFLLREVPTGRRPALGLQLSVALAAQSTVHNLATHVLAENRPQVLFVKLDFIHDVMRAIDVCDCRSYSSAAIEDSVTFVDALVGRYMNLAGSSAGFSVVSTPSYSGASNRGVGIFVGDGFEPGEVRQPSECTCFLPAFCRSVVLPPCRDAGEALEEQQAQVAHDGTQREECWQADKIPVVAQIYSYRDQGARAIELLMNSLKFEPPPFENTLILADLLLETSRPDAEQALVDAAQNHLLQIHFSQDRRRVELMTALKHFFSQDYPSAFEIFHTMIDDRGCPVNPASWCGWCLLRQKSYAKAEALFSLAVSRDRLDSRAWDGLGLAFLSMGRAKDAHLAFENAVAIAPTRSRFKGLRSFALRESSRDAPLSV